MCGNWDFTAMRRGRGLPDPDEAFERLRIRWEAGSRSLREREAGERDWWSELAQRLGGEGAAFFAAFEAHVNEQAERWGRDRFRLGYALGASGLLEALDREPASLRCSGRAG